jgi:hypothetical protein
MSEIIYESTHGEVTLTGTPKTILEIKGIPVDRYKVAEELPTSDSDSKPDV